MQAERLKQRVLPALLHPVLDLKAKRLPQRVLPQGMHLKAERLPHLLHRMTQQAHVIGLCLKAEWFPNRMNLKTESSLLVKAERLPQRVQRVHKG